MKKHIVCFGDSNTHGYDGAGYKRFDENERWTCLLAKQLGDDYLVLEEGLGGRTTVFNDPIHEGMAGIDVITPILLSHEPVDLLIIMLGTNDTKERFNANSTCIGIGLQRLILKAKATLGAFRYDKANILVVTPKNILKGFNDPAMGKGCIEKSEGLGKEFKKVAEVLGCHYLDANDYVTDLNHTDYLHLDKLGHKQLADALTNKVKEIFK